MRKAMLTQCHWLIGFPEQSITLAVIATDHLTMHFSLPLPVPALSCPLTVFTAQCHLHIPASLLILSFSWLGYPLIPLVPGKVELDWDAYTMKNLVWQRWSQRSGHSFPSTSPMPGHPIASPGNWVGKMKILYHSTAQHFPVGSPYKQNKSQNAKVDSLHATPKSSPLTLSSFTFFQPHWSFWLRAFALAVPSVWNPY